MPRPHAKPPRKRPTDDDARPVGVRIIGGKQGGRVLEYSGDLRTRPMKDRVREAVFNLVGTGSGGRHAIDLFAGTGALGLEAVSRGASRATLIERHHPTSELIRKNARTIGLEPQCEIVFGDAFLWAKKFARTPPTDSTPWLVFCSPPYEFYASRREDLLEMIEGLWGCAPADSLFVVEADELFDFTLLPQPELWQVRTYLPAVVGIARKNLP